MRPRTVWWPASLAILLLVAAPAAAQCRIEGTARAEDGSPLAGASVHVEIPGQREPLTVVVGPDGSFSVEKIAPGFRVHVSVVREGRVIAESYQLVSQWVEKVDLVQRALATKVTGDWDLNPAGAPSGRLVGVVRGADGEVLPGARVVIRDTTRSATADSAGRYGFARIRAGLNADLDASAGGFTAAKVQSTVAEGRGPASAFSLKGVEPDAERSGLLSPFDVAGDTGRVTLRPEDASGIPSPGRQDVFRAIQFLPGVSGTSEASGDVPVRGTAPGSNLITLDGFTLYPVSRPYGPFSLLNMDAVDSVRFSASALDAADGGRLSAYERVTARSGSGSRATGSVDFSLLGARGVVSVPLGHSGSALFAIRRSSPVQNGRFVNWLADDGTQAARDRVGWYSGGKFSLTPTNSFQDMNGKIALKVGARDRLSATFYSGTEDQNNSRDITLTAPTSDVTVPSDSGLAADPAAALSDLQHWTATGVSAAWTHRWSAAASTSVSFGRSTTKADAARASALTSAASGGDYSFVAGRGGSNAFTYTNEIDDSTLRVDNTVAFGWPHALSFGGEMTTLDVAYDLQREVRKTGTIFCVTQVGVVCPNPPSSLAPLLAGHDSARVLTAYVQDSWRPFVRLTLTPGARFTKYDLASATYVEPRISSSLLLGTRLRLRAAWAIDHQFSNRITYEDRAQGDRDFWALADGSSIPVSRAETVSGGWSIEFPGVTVDMGGYYKRLEDLSLLAPRLDPGMSVDTAGRLLHQGTGTARGFEVLVQKAWDATAIWTSYSANKTELFFPTLESTTFLAPYDRLHEFKVAASQRIYGWSVSGAWVAATGSPYTPASGVGAVWYPGVALNVPAFGAKDSARLPAYTRLDLTGERTFRVNGFKSTVGVTVFNVYGRSNVAAKEYEVAGSTLTATDLLAMGRVINAFVRVGF